jgi:protein-S-isoprenylcysteine O-methyltransferase Ste14
VDLSAIASVGSAVALAIFLLVGVAGWRRRHETGSQAWLVLTAIAVTAVVLVSFSINTWQTAPETFVAILCILVAAGGLDAWTRRRNHGTDAVATST